MGRAGHHGAGGRIPRTRGSPSGGAAPSCAVSALLSRCAPSGASGGERCAVRARGSLPLPGRGGESFRWLWCSLASQNHRTVGVGEGLLEVVSPPLKQVLCASLAAC